MPTLTSNQVNSIIIKSAVLLNIIHIIFNHRDTEVVICIISSIKETRWPRTLSKYYIIYKAIVSHISETIDKFEPKSNCNTIFHRLYATILFTKVLLFYEKPFEKIFYKRLMKKPVKIHSTSSHFFYFFFLLSF